MNVIADQLDRLAERGPHADPGLVVARATSIATGTVVADTPTPEGPRRRPILVAAAAALIVGGGIAVLANGPTGNTPASSTPTGIPRTGTAPDVDGATAPEPAAVLPDLPDVSDVVPPTVVGTGPTDWYRLQPDLDVAWYSPNDGTSMLCFRTPVLDAACQPDEFRPSEFGGGPIGVTTAGDQLLVITLDPGNTVTLTLDDGTAVTAPLARDPQTDWGTARFHLRGIGAATGLAATYAPAATTPMQNTTAPAGQLRAGTTATRPSIVPEDFPTDVPRPDTFGSMQTMSDDGVPIGWEFIDPTKPANGIDRCTEYAGDFDDTWTSTPDTDESPSMPYAQILTNAEWQVGIYCTDLDEYLVQVMHAPPS